MKLAFVVAFAVAFNANAEKKEEKISLASLLEEAKTNNPAVKAAYERWQSAEAKVSASRSWENPMVGIKNKKAESSGTEPAMKSEMLMVEQEIPFPGKISDEARMLHHEAKIAHEDYRARLLETEAQVKIRYHLLSWLASTADALKKDTDILEGIARVAQSRLSAGQSSADEALLAQAQLKMVENSVFEREQQKLIEEEELNALLGRKPGTRWGRFEAVPLRDLPVSVEELEKQARETNPMYLNTLHMQAHAAVMARRALLNFAPDFKVSYEREKFESGLPAETTIGAALRIPLWLWRPAGERKSAKAHQRQTQAESQSAQNDIFKTLYKEYTEVNLHRQLALNYSKEILPLAESALQIAQKNYETGRADFAKLTEAVRHLLEAQMKYYEELYHYGEHWAMLEVVAGKEIEGVKN
ncbi:MAG: TolC family protein [Elusimicrobia bacterium]|nr:TolC family protein [Elusimicrobiota bacterium]